MSSCVWMDCCGGAPSCVWVDDEALELSKKRKKTVNYINCHNLCTPSRERDVCCKEFAVCDPQQQTEHGSDTQLLGCFLKMLLCGWQSTVHFELGYKCICIVSYIERFIWDGAMLAYESHVRPIKNVDDNAGLQKGWWRMWRLCVQNSRWRWRWITKYQQIHTKCTYKVAAHIK